MMTTTSVGNRRDFCGLLLFPLFLALMLQSCAPSKETKSVPSTTEKRAITTTVKILTVNARHTLKEKSDVRRLAKLIKSTEAEIVAVQQIEKPQEGNDGFDAVKELAKQAEMYNFFGKARFFEGFDSGNALLSMYPMKGTIVHELPAARGKVRRSLAFGAVDVGLRSLDVASTELDDQSSSERVTQAEEILAFSKLYAGDLLVVCGDLNESLSGKAAAKMQEGFTPADTQQDRTLNASQHLYVVKDPKIRPLSVLKVKAGNSIEGLLVTVEVTQ